MRYIRSAIHKNSYIWFNHSESDGKIAALLVPLQFGYLVHPKNLPRLPHRKTIVCLHRGQTRVPPRSAAGRVLLPASLPMLTKSFAETRVIGFPSANSLTPRVNPPVQARIASSAPNATMLPKSSLATAGPTGDLWLLHWTTVVFPSFRKTRSIPWSPVVGVASTS